MKQILLIKFVMKGLIKKGGSQMSCIYFLGLIGAAIHFIGQATTFGAGVLGFLKAHVAGQLLNV